MGRRGSELEPARWGSMPLLVMGLLSFCMVYIFMSTVMRPSFSAVSNVSSLGHDDEDSGVNGRNLELETSGGGGCCRGVPGLELWGDAVKWGTDFKLNSSEQCCKACKAMCTGKDGPCLCDSWVFCGNKEACGEKFGECWLKKQKDTLSPEKQETQNKVMWTSGLIFGRGEGIIALVHSESVSTAGGRRKRHQTGAAAVQDSGKGRYNLRRRSAKDKGVAASTDAEKRADKEIGDAAKDNEITSAPAEITSQNGNHEESSHFVSYQRVETKKKTVVLDRVVEFQPSTANAVSEEVNGTPEYDEEDEHYSPLHEEEEEEEEEGEGGGSDDEDGNNPGEASVTRKIWKFLST